MFNSFKCIINLYNEYIYIFFLYIYTNSHIHIQLPCTATVIISSIIEKFIFSKNLSAN